MKYCKINFTSSNGDTHEMYVPLDRMVLHKEFDKKENKFYYYIGICGVEYGSRTLTYCIEEKSYNNISSILDSYLNF